MYCCMRQYILPRFIMFRRRSTYQNFIGSFEPRRRHTTNSHSSADFYTMAQLSTEHTTVSFSDMLSSSNRERFSDLLRSQKPIDVQNLPWIRGKNMKDMKSAAVLIPLCLADGQPSVLFTLRSSQLSFHKREVSFPGGMVDQSDEGVVDTALREMKEEIGLNGELIEVLGQMLPLPGVNNKFLVTPVLGYCGDVDLAQLKINNDEVDEVFVGSIASLCSENNVRYTTFKRKFMMSMPVYVGQKHRIWGMTAVMLHQTLRLIAPGLYDYNFRGLYNINFRPPENAERKDNLLKSV